MTATSRETDNGDHHHRPTTDDPVEHETQRGPHTADGLAGDPSSGAHLHDHPHLTGEHHDHGQADDDHHHDGFLGRLQTLLPLFHSHGDRPFDSTLESSERGIWAIKVSLLVLGATALFQVVIVLVSGSVGLLADTVHNFADALTALPLWLAFMLSRRPANRRYTYGYGRAEDVAGVVIVLVILASAVLAAYETYRRLLDPIPPDNLVWVMVAAVVGFVGNEAVAVLRMRVGREIGSAALVADGEHARVDGLTSLAVLLGALGVLAGYPLADPIVGLVISVAILFVLKDAAVRMWERLMDAVDPRLVERMEHVAQDVPGVEGVHDVRVRWLGHRLQADLHVTVDGELPTREAHRIAEEVRHALLHAQPQLSDIAVHVDPREADGESHHELTSHHLEQTRGGGA